jgi:hypothetical protein
VKLIVARNFCSSGARVKSIGSVGGDGLCFLEVKTRTLEDVKLAEAAVDRAQKMGDCGDGAGISEGVTTVVPVALRDCKRILWRSKFPRRSKPFKTLP